MSQLKAKSVWLYRGYKVIDYYRVKNLELKKIRNTKTCINYWKPGHFRAHAN